jgi:methylglutaconyl-CoA hydratase
MPTLKVSISPRGLASVEMARGAVFNAFDEQMIAELDQAFESLGANPTVRAIALSGEGKAFSAGADLDWMKRASVASHDDNLEDARRFAGMLARVASCPKPTIAQVHGVALGGGVGLICACDLAVASSDAKFAVSEARFGILPSVIGPYLVNAVGKRQAVRLALTAERIGAQEALAIGLVQRVVSINEMGAAVEAWFQDIGQNGPAALSQVKALYSQFGVRPVTEDVRELTARTIADVRRTPEAREGFDAFLAKRKANWVPADDVQ